MLTYRQQANPATRMTMKADQQINRMIIDGYALVMGNRSQALNSLTEQLWEHGVPAYAVSGATAVDMVTESRGGPAVILLDLEGMDAAAIVTFEDFRLRCDAPLLCIAGRAPHAPHAQALMQVASDFVITPYQPQELILRIRRICTMSLRAATAYAPLRDTRPMESRTTLSFSATERTILRRLSETLGEPVHLDELAELVPGDDYDARIKLLRVHIFRLRQKIEPRPKNPSYLRTVRDYGYYLAKKVEGLE